MIDYLFVYGTLGPGRPNEHVMQNIGGEWQPASLRGRLEGAGWGAAMGFPGLVIDESGDEVRGHIFSSAALAGHWAELDAFEGAEYARVLTPVTLADGSQIDAHVYVLRR